MCMCNNSLCSIIDAMNVLQVLVWLSVFVTEYIAFLILQVFLCKNISINYANLTFNII